MFITNASKRSAEIRRARERFTAGPKSSSQFRDAAREAELANTIWRNEVYPLDCTAEQARDMERRADYAREELRTIQALSEAPTEVLQPADPPYIIRCPACGHDTACGKCISSNSYSCCHCGEPLSKTADPELRTREDTDADAPKAEVCEPWSESGAIQRAFGTRPARKLKSAQQDELFNPNPQRRLIL